MWDGFSVIAVIFGNSSDCFEVFFKGEIKFSVVFADVRELGFNIFRVFKFLK